MTKSILIVEDELPILNTLADLLRSQGYEVWTAARGDDGLQIARDRTPHLVILDVMLPGMHGYDVCRRLRQNGFTNAVLFLTAKGDEVDKLTGFDRGGDDYVTKPFSLNELLARVKALLRRFDAPVDTDVYVFDGITVNFTTYEIDMRGEAVKLSAKEMDLLRFLIKHRGQVLTRDVLLDQVWNYDAEVSTRTVDTHILNLRRKLAGDGPRDRYIETIHGVGYKFVG